MSDQCQFWSDTCKICSNKNKDINVQSSVHYLSHLRMTLALHEYYPQYQSLDMRWSKDDGSHIPSSLV